MSEEEKRLEHLKLIQPVIERLARNSFLVKGWSVTLVSALLALVVRGGDGKLVLLLWVPIPVFWGLDAYYLYLERRFRNLYDAVARGAEEVKGLKIGSMAVHPWPQGAADGTRSGAVLAVSVHGFHFALAALATVAALFL